jgi:PAS domain S-box-containing protein
VNEYPVHSSLFGTLLEAAGEGVYGLDCDGLTTFVNPAAVRMLGWPAEELIGRPMHATLHHSHPDGSPFPREECPIYAAFNDGQVHHVENEVFWRKDGTCFPVEYTSTPIREDGKPTGAVVVFWDITQRKQAEERLRRALAEVESLKTQLEEENLYLREEVSTALGMGDFVGESPGLQKVLRQVQLVAPTDAAVLITGESGTGKELVARAIHDRSSRRERALIKVNCSAVPESLFESEFFGHVRGAFTGALKDKPGRFELADGGTLFLDEIGEVPFAMQAKLLRALQEQELERVGDTRTRKINVRVIAATNRDLKREVEAHRFRQDLFYRLSVFPIEVPPLRERRDDIQPLVAHFVKQSARRLNCPTPRVTHATLDQLAAYDWPGNVRELQNAVERAVILAAGGQLRIELAEAKTPHAHARARAPIRSSLLTRDELKRHERESIAAALDQSGGKVSGPGGAAELLGMKPTTLASRIRALGLKRKTGA